VASFVHHRDIDFKYSAIEARISEVVASATHFQPFGNIAKKRIGDSIATNIMMLGYAWQAGLIPLSFDALDQAIALNGVAVKVNREAFHWGRKLHLQPDEFKSTINSAEPKDSIVDAIPDSLDALMAHRVKHLTLYQGSRLAKRYTKQVERVAEKCQLLNLDDSLAQIVASQYARLLAYKDEYEVARLYSLPAFKDQLNSLFEGDFSIKLHLAPPLLSKIGSDGRPRKRIFGPAILSFFNILQKGAKLRGTVFDVFGYTAERKLEREWIRRYEADIDTVLEHLSADTLDASLHLLSVPEQIRGFGPVKLDAMKLAEEKRTAALESLLLAGSTIKIHAA